VTRIGELSNAEFADLEATFTEDGPVCPICALETLRQALSGLVFDAPPKVVSKAVRKELAGLLYRATSALVTHRADAENDEQGGTEGLKQQQAALMSLQFSCCVLRTADRGASGGLFWAWGPPFPAASGQRR
jgi:hypothetical protein